MRPELLETLKNNQLTSQEAYYLVEKIINPFRPAVGEICTIIALLIRTKEDISLLENNRALDQELKNACLSSAAEDMTRKRPLIHMLCMQTDDTEFLKRIMVLLGEEKWKIMLNATMCDVGDNILTPLGVAVRYDHLGVA